MFSDADILTRASADVRQAFVSKVNFRASWVFIATWDTVSFCGGKFMRPVSKQKQHDTYYDIIY